MASGTASTCSAGMLAARRDRVGAVGDEGIGLAAGDELAVDVAAGGRRGRAGAAGQLQGLGLQGRRRARAGAPLDSMRSNIVKA